MRSFAPLLVLLHLVCYAAYALDSTTASLSAGASSDGANAISTALELFPSCAVKCLMQEIPTSPCGLNTTCVCHDMEFQAKMASCLAVGCPKLEALSAKNASATMCGEPVRDKRLDQALVAIVGCSVASIIFLIRILWVMFDKARGMGAEDWTIIASMVFTICVAVMSVIADTHGVGMDIWVLPPSEIEAALFWFIIAELFYFLAQGSVKISILLFILRIFPEKEMRQRVFAVIGVVAAYTLAFLVATLFQCQPIAYTWKQLYEGERGRCNNVHLQGWMSAIFNIVLDIMIIVLPIKSLWALQLSVPRKITAIAMFSLGTLYAYPTIFPLPLQVVPGWRGRSLDAVLANWLVRVTIISILRLQSLIDFSKSINLTWDSRQAGSWSQCELYVAIICACLPVLRVVIITLGHRYLGWSMVGSAIGGNDKPKGSTGRSHSTGRTSTGAGAGGRRHRGVSTTTAAVGAPDGPRGDFIRLDDLENGPASRDGDGQPAHGEKSAADKGGAGRNTIVVTRKVSIQSDV